MSPFGRFGEGIAVSAHTAALTRRAPFFLGLLAWALALAGRTDEARSGLGVPARPAASRSFVSEAWVLAVLGETDMPVTLGPQVLGDG